MSDLGLQPGVHHASAWDSALAGPASATRANGPADPGRLEAAGWQVTEVTGGATKAEVLQLLADALAFPDWFGGNLDALWDCLTDLTRPTVVIWHSWEQFAVTQSRDWAALLRVLTERAAQAPDFAVICA